MMTHDPSEPWNEGVEGATVLSLINSDARFIRVEAGPGTGKSYGLARRVLRLLHADGANVAATDILVVAFNRVIAKQLRKDIEKVLSRHIHNGLPAIRTVHRLCRDVVGDGLRLLLPHEREAMICDVLTEHPMLQEKFKRRSAAEQALRAHEAKLEDHIELWQAVRSWLTRHKAGLISDLPGLLLDRLQGGDHTDQTYRHVIVDEFQDLTEGEQRLFFDLLSADGSLVAVGDRRQSIYAFRGNDRFGLAKLDALVTARGETLTDFPMTECRRCPEPIVHAANRLMSLNPGERLVPANKETGSVHVVTWDTPEAEAEGMARRILENRDAAPKTDRHLVMVTRRSFGYHLRSKIKALRPDLVVDLSFNESPLEEWPVRETFLFFTSLVAPDAPTWRAWLAYQKPTGKAKYHAARCNAPAYLALLSTCPNGIDAGIIIEIALGSRKVTGEGGSRIVERAQRWCALRELLNWQNETASTIIDRVFSPPFAGVVAEEQESTTVLDLQLLRTAAQSVVTDLEAGEIQRTPHEYLQEAARHLRRLIATREVLSTESTAPDIEVMTLWGAKGVTAEHVYVLGLCHEALPGTRRDDYPGDTAAFEDEQRRLFYVTLTRAKKTLVLSRSLEIEAATALGQGLRGQHVSRTRMRLKMSDFLRDILPHLPRAVRGVQWDPGWKVVPAAVAVPVIEETGASESP